MNEKQTSNDRQLLLIKNQKTEELQRIYTDKEASSILRISQVTLWRERKAGKISFSRSGSKIVYTQEDLENYINRSRTPATATLIAA